MWSPSRNPWDWCTCKFIQWMECGPNGWSSDPQAGCENGTNVGHPLSLPSLEIVLSTKARLNLKLDWDAQIFLLMGSNKMKFHSFCWTFPSVSISAVRSFLDQVGDDLVCAVNSSSWVFIPLLWTLWGSSVQSRTSEALSS